MGRWIFVDYIKGCRFVGNPYINGFVIIDVNILLLRDVDDMKRAVFIKNQQLIVVSTFDYIAVCNFASHKTSNQIEAYFNLLCSNSSSIKLFNSLNLGFSRVCIGIFFDKFMNILNSK